MWIVGIIGLISLVLYPIHRVDPTLQLYLDQYLTIVNKQCSDDELNLPRKIIIEFVPKFDDEMVAYCRRTAGLFEIRVSKKYWDSPENIGEHRRVTIFHELSHCILEKEHVDNLNNYMYYSVIDISQPVLDNQVYEDARKKCQKN